MKNKTVKTVIGSVLIGSMLLSGASVYAEEATVESYREMDPFKEGSQTLTDLHYIEGNITDKGWESEYLSLAYNLSNNITFDLKADAEMSKYHERFGSDKAVSVNEFVAVDKENGYVQMVAIANPNDEKAEDILARFVADDQLQLTGKVADEKIGGRVFKTNTGVYDGDRYMLAVCADESEDVAIALRIKYSTSAERANLLSGFAAIEKPVEMVTNN